MHRLVNISLEPGKTLISRIIQGVGYGIPDLITGTSTKGLIAHVLSLANISVMLVNLLDEVKGQAQGEWYQLTKVSPGELRGLSDVGLG